VAQEAQLSTRQLRQNKKEQKKLLSKLLVSVELRLLWKQLRCSVAAQVGVH
jgi:hypothetical protein